MARVFTTSFEFEAKSYTAMVTVQQEHTDHVQYNIAFLDEGLYQILPEGDLSFRWDDESLPQSLQNPAAKELFLTLKRAISDYLLRKPVQKEKGVHFGSDGDTSKQE